MDKINIRQLFDCDTCTYTYVLWDSLTSEALIIDPVLEQIDRDLNYLNKLQINLKYILETHVHADHITAASKLRDETSAKICYGSKTGVKGADILFNDNDQINIGKYIVKVIHTPGHTVGCVSYYVDGFIFTGDTLFIEGTGRTDFQGGSAKNTYNSIRNKIFTYPEETVIYPGHNYAGLTLSTIKYERKCNPNVGDDIKIEDFIQRENNMDRPYPKRFKIAVPANMCCGEKQK